MSKEILDFLANNRWEGLIMLALLTGLLAGLMWFKARFLPRVSEEAKAKLRLEITQRIEAEVRAQHQLKISDSLGQKLSLRSILSHRFFSDDALQFQLRQTNIPDRGRRQMFEDMFLAYFKQLQQNLRQYLDGDYKIVSSNHELFARLETILSQSFQAAPAAWRQEGAPELVITFFAAWLRDRTARVFNEISVICMYNVEDQYNHLLMDILHVLNTLKIVLVASGAEKFLALNGQLSGSQYKGLTIQ